MKKIITTAILALGAMTAANAQLVSYDLAATITSPAANTQFACDDDVIIVTSFQNNGPNDVDLTQDTTLVFGYLNSTDSQHVASNLQFFAGYDSFKIENGNSRSFTSRTRKARDLFYVYEDVTNARILFRDNIANGLYYLYADHTGIGRINPGNNMFEEASNFEDRDSTNDGAIVKVGLCTDLTSIRNINANTTSVAVYPNPTKSGVINFDYEFANNDAATVRVMDVTGRTVLTQSVKANAGVQSVTVDVANLQAGMYNLEIATSTGRGVSKFTVAK